MKNDAVHHRSVQDIFTAAIRLDDLAKRESYLQGVCGDDSNLRKKVDRFIAAASINEIRSPLDGLVYAFSPAVTVVPPQPVNETLGFNERSFADLGSIGPYKLLEQIGQGGFGTVYMAEQTAPVRRKVAVKILKPGMDSKEVIARFEAERQALAMMDHPNISRVIDGGTTETGRPYFVMELVRGVPLTE